MAKEPTGARDDDWYVRSEKEPKFDKPDPIFHTVNGCGTVSTPFLGLGINWIQI